MSRRATHARRRDAALARTRRAQRLHAWYDAIAGLLEPWQVEVVRRAMPGARRRSAPVTRRHHTVYVVRLHDRARLPLGEATDQTDTPPPAA